MGGGPPPEILRPTALGSLLAVHDLIIYDRRLANGVRSLF